MTDIATRGAARPTAASTALPPVLDVVASVFTIADNAGTDAAGQSSDILADRGTVPGPALGLR